MPLIIHQKDQLKLKYRLIVLYSHAGDINPSSSSAHSAPWQARERSSSERKGKLHLVQSASLYVNCKSGNANMRVLVGSLSLLASNSFIPRPLVRRRLLRPPLQASCMACIYRTGVWGWESIWGMQQFISTDKSGDCEGVMRVGSVSILEPEFGRW
jgi:hypothetical protein